MKKGICLIAAVFLLVGAAGCGKKKEDLAQTALSELRTKPILVTFINTQGKKAGTAKLTQTADGVLVNLNVYGLTPGLHGIHFHQNPKCEPPKFESAGSHINPDMKQHGFNNPNGPHAGDLKNITADSNGHVKAVFLSSMVTLTEGRDNSLLKNGGSALVIHAKADDYKTDPAGNSGDRILCGVIKK